MTQLPAAYFLHHNFRWPDKLHAIAVQSMATSTRCDMEYRYMVVPSPVGELTLVARVVEHKAGLAAILWQDDKPNRVRLGEMLEDKTHPLLLETARQLSEYFAGTRQQFEVALDFAGTTFQQEVWQALLTIPFGQTRSYGEIARQIGRPAAVRAVGAANGKNPISIIAPCHRVIGATGELTGFAGGLHAKETLLTLEGISLSSDREAQKTGHARRRAVQIDTAQGSLF